MTRFRLTKITDTDDETSTAEQQPAHPAFRLGTFMASWFTASQQRLADFLNRAQHRVGFRVRNTLLALVGLHFLLYFIALLT